MKAIIYISGVIGEETTLVDVIRQYKAFENPTEVEVNINSIGGNVEEGESIYNYLKALDIPVTTIAKKAYSISAQIFAAGDTRIIEDVDKAFMIHFAWADGISGKAEKLELVAKALREIENKFASFYSEMIEVDEDTIRALLDNDTMLSGSEAVEMGFATELKEASLKAVAMYELKTIEKQNKIEMKKSKSEQLGEAISAVIAKFFKSGEVKALMLQDSEGKEIDFPDVEVDGTPKVGDKGMIDNSPVPDNSYIMPSLEDATVVFVDGVITEIIPKENEETDEEKEARLAAEELVKTEAEAKAKLEAEEKEARLAAEELVKTEAEAKAKLEAEEKAKAEAIKEISVWEIEVVNTSFAEGDIVMLKGWDGGDDYPAQAGEFMIKDGRKIVTDASGKIVKIKPADSEEEVIIEAKVEEKIIEAVKAVEVKIEAKYKEANEALEIKLKAANKLLTSKEVVIKGQSPRVNTGTKRSDRATEILSKRPKRKNN